MLDYIYNDKTGLYYLASRVFSDKYLGAPLTQEEIIKMNSLEKEYSKEIEKARCTIMLREDLKDLGYMRMLLLCADLLLQYRLDNSRMQNNTALSR